MTLVGSILLGVGIAIWIGMFAVVFVMQFVGLSAESTGSRIARSLLSAVLWPLIIFAVIVGTSRKKREVSNGKQ